MEPVLVIPLVNCLKNITVIRTTIPIKRFGKEPKSALPTPPAKLLTPTGKRDNPIDKTITPVTTGGKYLLIFFMMAPINISNIAPTKAAPRIPSYPYLLPIERATGTKAKLVPTTIGSLAPIGPIRYA